MIKKLATIGATAALLAATAMPAFAAGGFNQFGYNYAANVFVGTGSSWCQGKLGWDKSTCDAYMTPFQNDKLVMKWSKAWDAAVFGPDEIRENGDELPWTTDAWVDNEWNGQVPGGSGVSEHAKIIWIGSPANSTNPLWRDGGYAIWGAFEAIFDRYTCSKNAVSGACPTDLWPALAVPAGYGGN